MDSRAAKTWVWSILVFGIVALVTSLWFVSRLLDPGEAVPGSPEESVSPTAPGPTSEAQEVVLALDRLPDDPASLAAAGTEELVGDVSVLLEPETTVTAIEDSWRPDGTGAGGTITVDVTEPGESTRSYLALMIREEGMWKVLATVEEVDQ